MEKEKIHEIGVKFLNRLLENKNNIKRERRYQKLYLAKDGSTWLAYDNHFGCDILEEFHSKQKAIRWLRGEFEVV